MWRPRVASSRSSALGPLLFRLYENKIHCCYVDNMQLHVQSLQSFVFLDLIHVHVQHVNKDGRRFSTSSRSDKTRPSLDLSFVDIFGDILFVHV